MTHKADEIMGLHVRVPGAKVFVRVKGAGKPVLMLHGGGPGTSSCDWLKCMAACGPGVQCFAPDFPGFGNSSALEDGRPYGTNAFVDTALALMDSLCLDQVVLAGHSMGAAVAAALAVQHPERVSHLVLLAPGGGFYGITDYASAGMAEISRAVEEPSESRLKSLVELMCHQPDGRAEQVRRRLQTLSSPSVLAVQRKMNAKRASPNTAEAAERAVLGQRMGSFRRPLSLVWGEQERFNPVELGRRILARLPSHAAYALLPAAGHNIQCDQPAAVAHILAGAALASQ